MNPSEEPECERCGNAMVLRTARKTGKQFYGCSKYPDCTGTLSLKQAERKVLKRARNEEDRLKFSEGFRLRLIKPKYYEYIRSDEWKRKKAEMERAARYRCQVCNKGRPEVVLNVHHRTYARLGHETQADLVVLCRECHAKYHNKLPVPPA